MGRAGRRSVRKSDGPLLPATTNFPDRLYYRIGEVARICGVAPSVLRFWETQFPQLKPNKGGTGQRLYRRKELELALRIRQLVYDEGYTLAGARHALSNPAAKTDSPSQSVPAMKTAPDTLKTIRCELHHILEMLSQQSSEDPRRKTRTGVRLNSAPSLFPELTDQSACNEDGQNLLSDVEPWKTQRE